MSETGIWIAGLSTPGTRGSPRWTCLKTLSLLCRRSTSSWPSR